MTDKPSSSETDDTATYGFPLSITINQITSYFSLSNVSEQQAKTRLNIAQEILATERTYLERLKVLQEYYYEPLMRTSTSTNGTSSASRLSTRLPPTSPPLPFSTLPNKATQSYFNSLSSSSSLTVSSSLSSTTQMVSPLSPSSPSSAHSKINVKLSRKTVNEIFANLDDIIRINMELLNMLEERLGNTLKPWDPYTGLLGDIFLTLAPFLKMYSFYIKNYPHALSVITTALRTNPKFHAWLHSTQVPASDPQQASLPPGFLSLQNFLVLPIQRIPRYRLLIASLLKSTPESLESDHKALTKAFHLIDDITSWVNETIRQQEGWMRMLEVRRVLVGIPNTERSNNLSRRNTIKGLAGDGVVVAHRRFVKRGTLMKICRKRHQAREFFLFSDMLIYASSSLRSETFQFHRKFDLGTLTIVDVPDTEDLKNSFQVITLEKSFHVYAETPKLKAEWIEAFNTAIASLRAARDTIRKENNFGSNRRVTTMHTQLELDLLDEQDDYVTTTAPPNSRRQSSLMSPFFFPRKRMSAAWSTVDPKISEFVNQNRVISASFRAPVWEPNSASEDCVVCHSRFNSIYLRKHHCRSCGKLVCDPCSQQRIYLPSGDSPERCCDSCWWTLFPERANELRAQPNRLYSFCVDLASRLKWLVLTTQTPQRQITTNADEPDQTHKSDDSSETRVLTSSLSSNSNSSFKSLKSITSSIASEHTLYQRRRSTSLPPPISTKPDEIFDWSTHQFNVARLRQTTRGGLLDILDLESLSLGKRESFMTACLSQEVQHEAQPNKKDSRKDRLHFSYEAVSLYR